MTAGINHILGKFIREHWMRINILVFQDRLNMPVFQLADTDHQLGHWDNRSRTLSISRQLMLSHCEVEVLEVLKHEMAHQYADEVLLPADSGAGETPHGSAFRYACGLLNIQHHARFQPQTEPSPILRRIQKLLNLAQSRNQHEAEAAMSKARALMTKYELEHELEESPFRYTYFGKPRRQRSLVQKVLAGVLGRFFHVRIIWIGSEAIVDGKPMWLLEVTGTAANLEIAEYVYDFLTRELEWLWRNHRQRNPRFKGKALKRDFQIGILKGLMDKLLRETPEQTSGETALIHLRQEKLRVFYENRHPHIRKTRSGTYHRSEAFHQGFSTGQNLNINKGLKKGGKTLLLGS